MVDEGCQRGTKRMLMITTLFIMCFGNEDPKTQKCDNVSISKWETVMFFLLINHLIGQPRNLTNRIQIIFGYWNINVITCLWCVKGIFNLYLIESNTPKCIEQTERSQICLEIIIGLLGSYKFIAFLVAVFIIFALSPIFCLIYTLFGYSIHKSQCAGFFKYLFWNKIMGINDFEQELRNRRFQMRDRNLNVNQREEVTEGFKEDQLERLKSKCQIEIKDEDLKEENFKTHSQCSICLDSYKVKDKVLAFKECPHIFHTNCIEAWLKINYYCPLCKSDKRHEIGETGEMAIQADPIEEEMNRIELLPFGNYNFGGEYDNNPYEIEFERPAIIFDNHEHLGNFFFRDDGEFRMDRRERQIIMRGIMAMEMLRRIEQLERDMADNNV